MAYKQFAICTACWIQREPDRHPVRAQHDSDTPEPEICFQCDRPTLAGIFVREKLCDSCLRPLRRWLSHDMCPAHDRHNDES